MTEESAGTRLSVATTNYNCAHVLERHLDSIFSLFPNIEYVVSDNYSSDGSWHIFEKYSRLHNLIAFQKHCTRGEGRNLALSRTTNDFFLYVDTDTIYLPIFKEVVKWYFNSDYPAKRVALHCVFGGVYPKETIHKVGGWFNVNNHDDGVQFRLAEKGLLKFYPVRVGVNVKRFVASLDHFERRYPLVEMFKRMFRNKFETLLFLPFARKLNEIYRTNLVDLGISNNLVPWYDKFRWAQLAASVFFLPEIRLLARTLRRDSAHAHIN